LVAVEFIAGDPDYLLNRPFGCHSIGKVKNRVNNTPMDIGIQSVAISVLEQNPQQGRASAIPGY
jgi:hypothetical protein